jgi:hypothetical protein
LLQNNAFPELTELTLQLWQPWIVAMLQVLSRDALNEYVLFPGLTSLNLVAREWNARGASSVGAPTGIMDKALITFFGEDPLHRDAQPVRRIALYGISISQQCEAQLQGRVDHVEVRFLIANFLEPG